MTSSNLHLLNKALLIVVPVFLKVKIKKALRCNIVNSEDFFVVNLPQKLFMSANKKSF